MWRIGERTEREKEEVKGENKKVTEEEKQSRKEELLAPMRGPTSL
jgi:hypothetical protein